jgi:hypothetical protein
MTVVSADGIWWPRINQQEVPLHGRSIDAIALFAHLCVTLLVTLNVNLHCI